MAAARRDDAPGSVGSAGVTTGVLVRAWAVSGEGSHSLDTTVWSGTLRKTCLILTGGLCLLLKSASEGRTRQPSFEERR